LADFLVVFGQKRIKCKKESPSAQQGSSKWHVSVIHFKNHERHRNMSSSKRFCFSFLTFVLSTLAIGNNIHGQVKEFAQALDLSNGDKRYEFLTTEESTAFVAAYVAIVELKNWHVAQSHLKKLLDTLKDGHIRRFAGSLSQLAEDQPQLLTRNSKTELFRSTWTPLLDCSTCLLPFSRLDSYEFEDNSDVKRKADEQREETVLHSQVIVDPFLVTSRQLATAMLMRFVDECIEENQKANRDNRNADFDAIAKSIFSEEGMKNELRKMIEEICMRPITEAEFNNAWLKFLSGESLENLLPCNLKAQMLESKSSASATRIEPLDLRLIFEIAREGNLLPSACSTSGYPGGIEQQLNWQIAYRTEHPNLLFVNGGDLFGPRKTELTNEEYRTKFGGDRGKLIVNMMNTLKLKVFAPGPSDFRLGIDYLREVKEFANFEFISTNVTDVSGTPIFKPFVVLETDGGLRVAFVNVIPLETKVEDGLKVIPPDEAIRRWLPEILENASLIVLTSQFANFKADREFLSKYPEIGIIVGCDPMNSTSSGVIQMPACALHLDSHVGALFPTLLEAKISLPFKGFYSEESLSLNRERSEVLLNSIARSPIHKNRPYWIRDLVLNRGEFPMYQKAGQSAIIAQIVALDEKTWGNPNAFSAIMNKEPLREAEK
jgi:hypothetical protein